MAKRKDKQGRVLGKGEYQRPNGTYEYRWLGRNHKRHCLYAPTLEKLRDKEKELNRDLLNGIDIEEKMITLNDLYVLWQKLKKGLKDNTFRNYKYMYEKFVMPDFGENKVYFMKKSDVRVFYNMLHDDYNLKVTTIDGIHGVIHQVLELGVEDGYIRHNPSSNAMRELKKLTAHEVVKRRGLTQNEQRLIESYIRRSTKYERWYPIFTIMLWTGMRVGETIGLTWDDIDFRNDTIDVNHTLVHYRRYQGEHMTYAINTTKTKAGTRLVPMLPIVREAFIAEKERQEELGIECTDVIDGVSNFVFCDENGKVFHEQQLNKIWKKLVNDCNAEILATSREENPLLVPKISNHILRHTFATRMVETSMNIKAMQDILGHSDIQTTMNIYADATKDLKKQEMKTLEEFFINKKLLEDDSELNKNLTQMYA